MHTRLHMIISHFFRCFDFRAVLISVMIISFAQKSLAQGDKDDLVIVYHEETGQQRGVLTKLTKDSLVIEKLDGEILRFLRSDIKKISYASTQKFRFNNSNPYLTSTGLSNDQGMIEYRNYMAFIHQISVPVAKNLDLFAMTELFSLFEPQIPILYTGLKYNLLGSNNFSIGIETRFLINFNEGEFFTFMGVPISFHNDVFQISITPSYGTSNFDALDAFVWNANLYINVTPRVRIIADMFFTESNFGALMVEFSLRNNRLSWQLGIGTLRDNFISGNLPLVGLNYKF